MTRVTIALVIAAALVVAAFLFVRDPVAPGRAPGTPAAAARPDAFAAGSEDRAVPARSAASPTVVGAPGQPRGPVVRGHVVDRAGVPVNHAAVRLELKSPDKGPDYATVGSFDVRVPVEADGTFGIPVPHHAQFTVTAEAKGFAIAGKSLVMSGDDVDLVLDAPVRLAGRVVHLVTREPLAEAKIEVEVPSCPHAVREAVTGADGVYAFEDLPPIVVSIETRLAGFIKDRADVDLASGAAEREVALDPGLAVAGRIVAAETGRPLEGVRVRSWNLADALTDAQGAFRVTGLVPGTWTFRTRIRGRIDGWAVIAVAVGRTPEDVLISVPVARQISGIVVDQDGRPLAGATVEAGAEPMATQADGRFVVDHEFELDADPSQNSMRLRANREGFTPAYEDVEPQSRDVTVRLIPADVTISGRVQDAEGRPVEGVRVICAADPRGRVTGTDAAGRFVFERSDRATEYRLWASAPGYGDMQLDVPRPGDAAAVETTITLAAPRRIHVTGEVVDDRGEAIPGARLEVRSDERVIVTSEAGPDGRFDVVAIQSKPESVDITASAAGYDRSGIGIDCTQPVSQFTFRLSPLGRIRGRVVDAATGEAVSGAEITLCVEDGSEIWDHRGRTTESPDFSFEAPPGAFELRISSDRYLRGTRRIDVAPRATTDVGTIELVHGGAIEGVIRPASGPSAEIAVMLASPGRTEIRQHGATDSSGWFHLDCVAPGNWEVFGAEYATSFWTPGRQPVRLVSFGSVEIGPRSVARIDGRMPPPATIIVDSGGAGSPAVFDLSGPNASGYSSESPDPLFHLVIRSTEGFPLAFTDDGPAPEFSGWWKGERFSAAIPTLPAGRFRVSLESEGRGPVEAVVQVEAGESRRIVLALPPAAAPGK